MSDVLIALEELKKSVGKGGYKPKKVTSASVWGNTIQSTHRNTTCHGHGGHFSGTGSRFMHQRNWWICQTCQGKTVDQIYTQKGHSGNCHRCNNNTVGNGLRWPATGWIICEKCAGTGGPSGEKIAAKIDAMIKSEKKKVTDNAKKIKTIEEAAAPYINSGLAEPFAIAIAKDVDLIDQILDLWEQNWWKQYPPDDVLVCAVLNGELSEDDARWLNDIRSDHQRLALACVNKEIELDWARALLSAGFIDHPEAVPDVLDGGHPLAIARIRRFNVDENVLPPQLGFNLSKANKKKSGNGYSISKASVGQINDILKRLNENQIKVITSKYVSAKERVAVHKTWITKAWGLINERKFPANEKSPPLKTLAKQLGLRGRSTMTKDELRNTLKAIRTVLRIRIKSQIDAIGLELSDFLAK